ncbi:MAG TPA: heavy metal-responsive transcriptional regulator [Actinomycetota bacterium]|nr:heavy metal-responsive transcriptional regulator [Actinomycetota bacterium]
MFFIGKLAERTGISRDAIRYYESLGVLPQPERTGAGYRVYGPADVERLEFIGQAQVLGLTLDEIADVLEIVGEGRAPCDHVRERLAGHLERTRERIRELRFLERRLASALAGADATDVPDGAVCRCRIIEAAVADHAVDPVERCGS